MSLRGDMIRVGIIRCDTHAFWYAPLFEKPNPDRYRKAHRGCHYYFYRPDDPSRLRVPTVPGMTVSRVFDEEDRDRAAALSDAFEGRPRVCDSFEEVSDDVDLVYIADCNYEGKDHLRLAEPGLSKGVPHFVDKPFAFTLEDARTMIDLAKRHETAVMCASLLRYSPFLERFRGRLRDIAPVGSLLVPSYSTSLATVFHGVSVVQCVMGEGCEWTECMGPDAFDVLRLGYAKNDAIILSALGTAPGYVVTSANYHHCAYQVTAYGARGAAYSPRVDDYLFPHGGVRIVKMAKAMAQSKQPPISYASMLEPMEMIEAARLAHKRRRRVYLDEVRT